MDQRDASQPDLTSAGQNGAAPSGDKATSIQDGVTSSQHKATSSHDGAISSQDKATSIQESDRPEPAMPPLRIDRGRAQRLRADAQRPLSENLADGIALSHVLLRYARDTPHR